MSTVNWYIRWMPVYGLDCSADISEHIQPSNGHQGRAVVRSAKFADSRWRGPAKPDLVRLPIPPALQSAASCTPLILTQADLLAIAFLRRAPIHYRGYQGVHTIESALADEVTKNSGGYFKDNAGEGSPNQACGHLRVPCIGKPEVPVRTLDTTFGRHTQGAQAPPRYYACPVFYNTDNTPGQTVGSMPAYATVLHICATGMDAHTLALSEQ
ncbi:hypothetical protein B0H10DRAFT_1945602 [Mycena sp. CBHHK59/15]|nr:hypothetical protein B0H10DRAFT_1945602 [Mycena sp. CBHHK59/15]